MRVVAARNVQLRRFFDEKIYTNAQMGPRHLRKHCVLTPEFEKIMENAVTKLGLARGVRPNPQEKPNNRLLRSSRMKREYQPVSRKKRLFRITDYTSVESIQYCARVQMGEPSAGPLPKGSTGFAP